MKNSKMLRRLLPVLEKHEELVGAYLFGSRATDDYTLESDLDICVLFGKRVPLEQLVHIQNAVEDATGFRADVVDLRTASPYLALDIVRGIRILCTDRFLCDEFELFVLSRAADLAPFERQRREALLGVGA